ncbi:MAG: nucleoside-diphosphate sugar epimerase/dehydratase [Desulfosalsimonadaceae bacterium]
MLKKGPARKRLLIIGAGDAAEKIFREIQNNWSLNYEVVGMLDDHPSKRGRRIHGVPVLGEISELAAVAEAVKAEEALIAIPSATGKQMRRIMDCCKEAGLKSKTVPGLSELIDGSLSVKSIRDVEYRDLLGREVIRMESDKIGMYLHGQTVLVTGAGGSIGSELCRQICRFSPQRLVLFERTENSLYAIDLELRGVFPEIEIISLLASIQDKGQIRHILRRYQPHTIFHAAAYKHVPLLEHQPWKAVVNNIIGTKNMAECAKEYSVGRFVLVSTDKAVCPANVMGASKRAAEMVVQAENGTSRHTQFMIVRFGNVVGSAGSVVPLFKKQIERGGPVTVTDPDVTRYFMLIPEACQLILQAGAMGSGGEIFLLDMGQPVKISEMARDLIRLSGFEPDTDIEIRYIGMRPGEKLHEELFHEKEEVVVPSYHEKIMFVQSQPSVDAALLIEKIQNLMDLASRQEGEAIKGVLGELVPGYKRCDQQELNNLEAAE